jgi:hypothetical protein
MNSSDLQQPESEKELKTPDTSLKSLNGSIDADKDGAEGISRYWRKNSSPLEALELANALRAMEKAAGYVGRNVGRIEWAGMSVDDENAIVLDPEMVMGAYPIPVDKFDYLLGIVLHEAFLRTEWTGLIWKQVHEKTPGMPVMERIMLQKIVRTGEDIYVDALSEKNILGSYTAISRRVAFGKRRAPLSNFPVSVDNLVQQWWETTFGEGADDAPVELGPPLRILENLGNELRAVGYSTAGVVARCSMRSNLYLEAWKGLAPLLSGWRVLDKSLIWYPDEPTQGEQPVSKKKQTRSRLASPVAKEVEEKLANHSSDITPIIRKVAGLDNRDVVPTSRWDFNIAAHPVIDAKMVGRIRWIFQTYAERKIMFNRGLTSGRVDRRRLYRAPVSGRCFFDKQTIPTLDWNICLLIDATGSMKGPKWRLVENTLGTMHKAFSGFLNRLHAYGYFEVEGICMISSLVDGKRVLSVPPCGQTASGQAIIAAAHFMPKDTRRRFIIHITDGESNFGCDVGYGIDHCKAQKIHLVTLGVACNDQETMRSQYGSRIQFIDHFGQLPSAIESLLKYTLLYDLKAGAQEYALRKIQSKLAQAELADKKVY